MRNKSNIIVIFSIIKSGNIPLKSKKGGKADGQSDGRFDNGRRALRHPAHWKKRGLQAVGLREAEMLSHEQDVENPERERHTLHTGAKQIDMNWERENPLLPLLHKTIIHHKYVKPMPQILLDTFVFRPLVRFVRQNGNHSPPLIYLYPCQRRTNGQSGQCR